MRQRVLVCPMDWGLGHAARCVPVIKKLIQQNAEVFIAADNQPYTFLKKEFPDIKLLHFPSYRIKYPAKGSMVFTMLLSIPKILQGIRKEHKLLEHIIKENNIDIVISDNRYGLWTKSSKSNVQSSKLKPYSIFITHQLIIKCPPFLKPVLSSIPNCLSVVVSCLSV